VTRCFEVVEELDPRRYLRVAGHGSDALAVEEVVDAEVLDETACSYEAIRCFVKNRSVYDFFSGECFASMNVRSGR